MSPAFHISLSLPFPSPPSLTLLILSLCCSFFPTSPFVLFPYLFTLPCLHHSFACLCHCVICFLPFIAPFSLPPLFSSCSRWIETFCLLQGMLFLPYWPTNRKESQPEMSLGCLFFWLPAMSACQTCVCVRVRVCVSHMGCCHHRQRDCCDIPSSFVTLKDKTVSLCPHLTNMEFWFWFNWWWKYSGFQNS